MGSDVEKVLETALVVGAVYLLGPSATLTSALWAGGSAAAATAIGMALSPKPSFSNLDDFNQGITTNIDQSDVTRYSIYGQVRVGGSVVLKETSGDDNKFLHIVYALADHEVFKIGEIFANQESIPEDYIDADGNVNNGTYKDKMRIKKYLGTADQEADPDLVSETTVGDTFRGRGVAYIYIRYEYDTNVYPQGIPTINAIVSGKNILDVRNNETYFSNNIALIINDMLTEPNDSFTPGIGALQDDINEDVLIASSNACDELVEITSRELPVDSVDIETNIITLAQDNNKLPFLLGDKVKTTGFGTSELADDTEFYIIPFQTRDAVRVKLATTLENCLKDISIDITESVTINNTKLVKTSEARYSGGGVVSTGVTAKETIESLVTAMAGNCTYIGGEWNINAGVYNEPVCDLTQDDLIGNITVNTKLSRADIFNSVSGTYRSPLNDGESTTYPNVKNDTYIAQDNGVTIPVDFELPMTQNPTTAQRLAKIKLEQTRQQISVVANFNLKALNISPNDNITLSVPTYGWENKVFKVHDWQLVQDEQNGSPIAMVKLTLQETANTIYDWSFGEETVVDPAPNSKLPKYTDVSPPTNLHVDAREIPTTANDKILAFEVYWTAPDDINVTNGGYYEIEYKKSSYNEWSVSFDVKGTSVQKEIKTVEPSVNYDVRIRSVNSVGVRSEWANYLGFSTTSPSGATVRKDYGLLGNEEISNIDYGDLGDYTTETTLDYGNIN